MKKDKWFKWKIAMAGTAGMAFLFHVIKSSPDYEAAVSQNAAVPDTATVENDQDRVLEEWLSDGQGARQEDGGASSSESDAGSTGRRAHGGHGFGSRGGGQEWQANSSGDSGGQGWQASGSGEATGTETWGTGAAGDAARTGRS
ncbi:hypothetical protein ACFFSY_12880 [Paenibacillus aurantiacus]|uniref:Uncharacterized protein n=1 Tax=Paenibacillus aurantiacus TaxID=1936118 RepID=A0ABV5KNL1_9BACL